LPRESPRPHPDRCPDGPSGEGRAPEEAARTAFALPDRTRGRGRAAAPRGGLQGDHWGGGRPSDLFRVREAVVPPEVFVRRTHDGTQRTRAAARPDRRSVADRPGTTRRTEAVRDQGGPGHDLEEQDAGTDRERRPSGEARDLRVQGRHDPVRHDEPPAHALHPEGSRHLRGGGAASRIRAGYDGTSARTRGSGPRIAAPRHPRRPLRGRIPRPRGGVHRRPLGTPLWPRPLLRCEVTPGPLGPPRRDARPAHERGVLARIVGFTDAKAWFAHPYLIA